MGGEKRRAAFWEARCSLPRPLPLPLPLRERAAVGRHQRASEPAAVDASASRLAATGAQSD